MMKALLGILLLLPVAATEEEKTFTVSGTVRFAGPVLPAKANKALADDPVCCALHQAIPKKEDLLVDEAGGLRWAFVWVKKGLEGKGYRAPRTPAVMDQVGCVFSPHLIGIQSGQGVEFRNGDPALHNVFGAGFANPGFNFGLNQGGIKTVTFPSQEVMFKVSCNVHPWMSAWIAIVDHPFFAVTDAAGKFEIRNLPPGAYTLAVWHESAEAEEQVLTVRGNLSLDFVTRRKP